MPIIHHLRILHRDFYTIGKHLPKSDKLGIHSSLEKIILECLALAIEAAFCPKTTKRIPLEHLRVLISVAKNLVRTENELRIIDAKTYIRLSEQLIEISKMTSGWLAYLTQKER